MCSLSSIVATLFTLYNTSFSLTWEDGLNRIYLALLEIWKFIELFYLIAFFWFVCFSEKRLSRKGHEGPDGHPVEHEPWASKVAQLQRRQVLGKVLPAGWEMSSFTGERLHLECCVQFWSPLQEWYWAIWESLAKDHTDNEGTGEPHIGGKAKESRTVQPGEDEAQGDLISVYKHLQGRCKEDGARLFSMVPRDRIHYNRHSLKHSWFPLNIRAQIAHGGCDIHLWSIQKPSRHGPGQQALSGPSWARWGWTRWSLEVPCNHKNSAICEFCLINKWIHNHSV